jgi:indolepyruvate ferredoxin oxidoreductase beta subunit
MTDSKPINIAILAMGGEGGGVLADWLVHVGEQNGYLAQTTSVPGVAQRTGATIYYLELFPRAALHDDKQLPVLGLMPMPGDIDLVIASELMEAGRAVQRGLVTPDRTRFIASTHRVYSMTERTALADGRVDAQAILRGCEAAALKFTGFNMAKLAEDNKSVISAVLLGAIAGAQALPFSRQDYEAAVRAGGVSIGPSLAAFNAGYAAAQGHTEMAELPSGRTDGRTGEGFNAVLASIPSDDARALVKAGIERASDYQDVRYAREYIERLTPFVAATEKFGDKGQELLAEVARQLALGMTYEDTVRVAELKIRGTRFARVRAEVGATEDQIIEIVEFMHPRVQEIADTLPASLGRWLLRSKFAMSLMSRLTSRGRTVRTTSLRGFLLLYVVASLKPLRRTTLRYERETRFLAEWLETVRHAAAIEVSLAMGFARLRNLVKGYGDTHERGRTKYETIKSFIVADLHHASAAEHLQALIEAAEKDEDGLALRAELERLSVGRKTIATAVETMDAIAS